VAASCLAKPSCYTWPACRYLLCCPAWQLVDFWLCVSKCVYHLCNKELLYFYFTSLHILQKISPQKFFRVVYRVYRPTLNLASIHPTAKRMQWLCYYCLPRSTGSPSYRVSRIFFASFSHSVSQACSRSKVKVKVNVNLYSALSWTHLYGTQVWHAFSRDLTVLPAHPAFIRNGMNHTCLFLPSRSWYSFTDPGGMEGWVEVKVHAKKLFLRSGENKWGIKLYK